MKAFVVNVSRCNGCYSCQMGCKDEHCGNDWSPYAKPQPDWGQFWGKIVEVERGSTPKVKVAYTFIPCQHCSDAPCIDACSVGAISRREDGLVIVDPKKCTGCRNCLNVESCPYKVIYFNEGLNIAQKCTGCAHLLDRTDGIWTEPRCVDCCATEALKFSEDSDLSEEIANSETLYPEYGLHPRVHYQNLPKKFVAGTVYDPSANEVIVGATCTLTGVENTLTTTTDGFGDFWFENLAEDIFSLKIESNGKTKTIDSISTEEACINLNDIPLS
jgi:Fe-S-cluster-containing dehydrogenase component